MKEYTENSTVIDDQKKRLSQTWPKRKYSIDILEETAQQSRNLFNFSPLIDEVFLTPHTHCFETIPDGELDSLPENLCSFYSQNSITSSPSTPSSFGFTKSPSRFATVCIKNEETSKVFPHVEIYLVNDIMELTRAGLVFISEDGEVDLKIERKQGKELESTGKLDNAKSQLWIADTSQWKQIIVSIVLEGSFHDTQYQLEVDK